MGALKTCYRVLHKQHQDSKTVAIVQILVLMLSLADQGGCLRVHSKAFVGVLGLDTSRLAVGNGTASLGARHHKEISINVPVGSLCLAWRAKREIFVCLFVCLFAR